MSANVKKKKFGGQFNLFLERLLWYTVLFVAFWASTSLFIMSIFGEMDFGNVWSSGIRLLQVLIFHKDGNIHNTLSTIQSFTFTCISLYWVSGWQAGMVPNKRFFIKDNLCLITCNKKLLYGVWSDE